MQFIKKVAIISSAIMAFSAVSASAAWQFAGYDTCDIDNGNVYKIYNEIIDGNYTSKSKRVEVPESEIVWKAEGFEFEYPHAGYDRLYIEGNRQLITRYNNLFPQWETRFVDYFWEIARGEDGGHDIYQRQQTKIPGFGWAWDYGSNEEIDRALLTPTTRNENVKYSYKVYGVGPFDLNGNFVSDEVMDMYKKFGVDGDFDVYDTEPNSKELKETSPLHNSKLSEIDEFTGEYVMSDDDIAELVSSIQTKFVTGKSLRGDNPTKDVAAEYLKHGDAWEWDADTVRCGGGKISWTDVTYEMDEPYLMYQYLIVNGVVFDGSNDTPRIFRRTGGKATPNVEWKYAFAEAEYPYSVVEFKYIDGKLAVDKNGYPVYRYPTGEFANYYCKVTPTEIQVWLKDDVADMLVASVSRTDHDLGGFSSYVPTARKIVRD